MTTDDLRAILGRLEASTGHDREIDRALHTAVGLDMDDVVHRGVVLNAYTEDPYAAKALVDRLRPNWGMKISFTKGYCSLTHPDDVVPFLPDLPTCTAQARAPTPALAICTALVRALLARSEAQTPPPDADAGAARG